MSDKKGGTTSDTIARLRAELARVTAERDALRDKLARVREAMVRTSREVTRLPEEER